LVDVWRVGPGDDAGDEVGKIAVGADEAHDQVGVGVDVGLLKHAILFGGQRGGDDLAVAVGVVLGIAEEDGEVALGVGGGGGLATGN
jgi:hypothetical protein